MKTANKDRRLSKTNTVYSNVIGDLSVIRDLIVSAGGQALFCVVKPSGKPKYVAGIDDRNFALLAAEIITKSEELTGIQAEEYIGMIEGYIQSIKQSATGNSDDRGEDRQ